MKLLPKCGLAHTSIFASMFLGAISACDAEVIVYEGFDYGAAPSLLGGLGNTTEIGLQGTWTSNGTTSALATANYLPSGLTFSDLAVSGGLAEMSALAAGSDLTAAAARQLDVAAQSGTLWGSYLFRKISDGALRSVGSLLQGNVANVSDNTAYFSLANNEFNQSVGGVRVSAGSGGNAQAATGPGNVAPALDTTYLYVFRLDNIAAPSGTTQSATAWMLSELQYDNFKIGGLDETELNAAALGSGATDVMERVSLTTTNPLAVPGTFDDTDFLRLFNFSNQSFVTRFDEVKFSNESVHEAVVGVPEPSALLAIASGMGVLLGTRRLRRTR